MKKFDNTPIGLLVILSILLILETFIIYDKKKGSYSFKQIDTNEDGKISHQEYMIYKKNKKRDIPYILRSALSGSIRGFFMGYIANGYEGAITGAWILAVMNPIISSIEDNI